MATLSDKVSKRTTIGRPLPAAVVQILGDLHFRLDGPLVALHFVPDDTLWSVEAPGILRSWSAKTGDQLTTHHLGEAEELWVFSSDGKYLASASNDVSLYALPDPQLLEVWPQESWITACAFSPDSQYLAIGHDDGRITIISLRDRATSHSWEAHYQPISALQFSPDGKKLASSAEDRTIGVWDAAAGQIIERLTGHPDRLQTLVWHPDNKHLVAAGWDGSARIWDTSVPEQVILLNAHAEVVSALSFSPDGKMLATADSDHVVWLWNPFHGKVIKQFRGHWGEVTCLAFHPSGQQLFSGGQDTRLLVWDVATGASLSGNNESRGEVVRMASTPDGKQLAYVNGSPTLRVWNVAGGDGAQVRKSFAEALTAVAIHPQTGHLAVSTAVGGIKILEPNSLDVRHEFPAHKATITSLQYSPDGTLLASGGATDGYVYVWDAKTYEPVLLIPEATRNGTVETLAWLPDGKQLAVGGVDWLSTSSSDGCVCLWNVTTRKRVGCITGGTTSLAINPNGMQMAVASLADTVCTYELPSCKLLSELPGKDGIVSCLAYDPEGKRLATATEEGTLRLWDARTGQLLGETDLATEAKDLCFLQDGHRLCVGNANGTCYVLDLRGEFGEVT